MITDESDYQGQLKMIEHNIQALAVVKKGKLLEIVTVGDLAKLAPEMAATVLSGTAGSHRTNGTRLYQSIAEYSKK